MDEFYGRALAGIHAAAFGALAEAAAADVLRFLGDDVAGARVLDIGCGAGAMASVLTQAGVRVWGADLSPALLAIARRCAPEATFVQESMHDLDLPRAQAVCAIGEVINYLADPRAGEVGLAAFIAKAARALQPGGLLLFDAAGPGRIAAGARDFVEGDDWAVGTSSRESGGILTRRITTFVRDGDGAWRRGHEVHRLQLLPRKTVLGLLELAGFDAHAQESYGAFRLPVGLIAYRAVRRA